MNRKQMIIALCVVTIATSALAIGRKSIAEATVSAVIPQPATKREPASTISARQPSADLTAQQANADQKAQAPSGQVPQYIVYRQLFRHVVILKKKAEEEERNGRDGGLLRSLYKRNAKLNDAEARTLEQIAEESDRQVSEFDERAKKIIAEARAQHPGGELNPGETLPPPPAELRDLQEQRNTAVLQARDRLRTIFGEEAFERFDKFVQRDVAPKIKPVQLDLPRPTLPGSPRKQKDK
ncbi:MAG TPA: hypothetical protein VGW12_00395 [Pyrinomonadaceae bacterium]|nr:hypothetical protein [Pyrinomonadaceae bacterium]